MIWLLCLGLPALLVTPARAQEYRIAAPPAWVLPVEPGGVDEKRLGQISDGVYYLLSDSQIRLEDGQRVSYRRIASKATNAAAVGSVANVEIGFDPAYQSLTLHAINVIRDGRVIPKLDTATVRVLQRETELERRIYDGSKTVSVFLEDVRAGDVVDYAYSIRGSNPVFQGRDFGAIGLQFSVPVGRIHARLLVPADRDVAVVPRNSDIEAKVRVRDGQREYRWDVRNVAALTPESDAPGWYDPYPVVQWSEFADWAAVNRWARPLYAIPRSIGAPLIAEVERIRKTEPDAAGRMLAALRLVQGEIRYLGVEIGPGTHAPNPPDLVLERRFGDCKDKTLLTLTLLDRLGIEARAALVNTRRGRAIAKRQPSPGQFDHVIVRAQIDGNTYWLDPTRSTQNADLAHLVQPDFDLALVVDDDSRQLAPMTASTRTVSPRVVHVTFDASAGLEEPVDFRVSTTLEGERAESMRYSLSTSSFDEVQKTYLNFYATYFSGLSVVEPLQVADDETNNRIVMNEHYRIPDFSAWSESEKRHTADILAPDVDELLRSPSTLVRDAPLQVAHPTDVTVITETVLPSVFKIEPSTTRVDDPAFSFERSIKPKGTRFFITDHFRSLADEVASADTARYAGNLARARGETSYQLYWTTAAPVATPQGIERINWMLIVVAVLALLFWIWLAAQVDRYDPVPVASTRSGSLRGLGGWLVLPGFGLCVLPVVTCVQLYQGLDAWAADNWTALTTFGNPGYHALWAPVLLYELISLLGMLVFGGLLLKLFFSRRSSLPDVYIGFMVFRIAQMIGDALLTHALPTSAGDPVAPQLFGLIVSAAVWTAYFRTSERVRNTFVVRRVRTASVRKNEQEPRPEDLPAVPTDAFSL